MLSSQFWNSKRVVPATQAVFCPNERCPACSFHALALRVKAIRRCFQRNLGRLPATRIQDVGSINPTVRDRRYKDQHTRTAAKIPMRTTWAVSNSESHLKQIAG